MKCVAQDEPPVKYLIITSAELLKDVRMTARPHITISSESAVFVPRMNPYETVL